MDQSTNTNISRVSGLPRPSKLPVPRAGMRHSPSRENLQQSSRLSVVNPRLRDAPSRENPSSSTLSKPRLPSTTSRIRGTTPILPRKASDDTLFRNSSKPFLREGGGGLAREGGTSAPGGFGEQASSRKSIPSLSERAMETLQNIPSSPAIRKRHSSFFNSESPIRPTSRSSRPDSGYQNDMGLPARSVSSRPCSRASHDRSIPLDFRAATNTFRPPQATFQTHTPLKHPTSESFKTSSSVRSSVAPGSSASSSRLPSPGLGASLRQCPPSPVKSPANIPNIKSACKTVSSRPLKSRASVNGLFRKPSMPTMNQSTELDRIGFGLKNRFTTFSNTSSEDTSTTSNTSKMATITSVSSEEQETTPRKSSLALRDQIAKAKAAKRAAATKQVSGAMVSNEEVPVIATGTFDFGLTDDPFNQQIIQNGAKGLLRKRIDAARSDGRLNIAAMGLKEIPDEVMNMYCLESLGAQDGSWAEAVDLTRFVAADNEFELINDDVFPDRDPRASLDDEDGKGNQFGGLETLDLHGNVLIALPIGLRRLELLTILNLVSCSEISISF